MKPTQRLRDPGQSLWLDNIARELLDNDTLHRYIEDFARGLGPDEGFGIGIVVLQIFHDGGFQLGDAVEGAAADALAGDRGAPSAGSCRPPPQWVNRVSATEH